MDNKKFKRIRIIGLVALTVAVVIAVALTVYFVDIKDKKDNAPPTFTTYSIGERVAYGDIEFAVRDVQFFDTLDLAGAKDGNVLCAVYITVISSQLSLNDLTVDGSTPLRGDFNVRERTVKVIATDGQTQDEPVKESVAFNAADDTLKGNVFVVFSCGNTGIKYISCGSVRVALGEPHITEG